MPVTADDASRVGVPEVAEGPVGARERVAVVDVLRGFALFGILVVNVRAFRAPVFAAEPTPQAWYDLAAGWLIDAAFTTKFYVLFAFLFGYGLSVQSQRAGNDAVFTTRFRRRLLGLLLIGAAHAVLLYEGDILVTYAILGVILLRLRHRSDRSLRRIAITLIAVSCGWFLLTGIGLAIVNGFAPFDADTAAAADAAARGVAQVRGAPLDVIAHRLAAIPGALAFALLGQGPTALAMFLLGRWAGRVGLFTDVEQHVGLLRRVRRVGFAVGVPAAMVWATVQTQLGFSFSAGFVLAGALDFATAPFLSAAYLATVVLYWHEHPARRRRLSWLAHPGRLALSNYLLQSLVGALLFTGYGFTLYGRIGALGGLLIAVAVFASQVPLSAVWLRRYRYGPAEWLLRSFTYARRQPMRRHTTDKEH